MQAAPDKHILIVDDEPEIQDIVQQGLERFGFTHISTAANGQEALEILQREKVDLVLSDWNMPIMDGRYLLHAIRNNDRLDSIPVIVMSGGKQALTHAVTFGATAVVSKPFTIFALLETIQSVLPTS